MFYGSGYSSQVVTST